MKLFGLELRRAGKVEKRGYADIVLAGLEALAHGDVESPLGSSAVEQACCLYGNAFAGAELSGVGSTRFHPEVRKHMARELIRHGESVWYIADGPLFRPVIDYEVVERKRYRLTFARPPSRQVQVTVNPERVLHFRYSIDSERPWEGVGPFSRARVAAAMGAMVEQRLGQEAGAPVAQLLPVPAGQTNLSGLGEDLSNAKGGVMMAESTSAGWDGDRAGGTSNDWTQRRVGAHPPAEMVELRRDALMAVVALAGVPPSLAGAFRTDGTQVREDYRRFIVMSVEPLARIVEREVMAKLGLDVRYSFYSLWGHDVQGRATALAKLVDAGIPLADARKLAGLL